jgi:molybdenum cofactor cytidylyltransferase
MGRAKLLLPWGEASVLGHLVSQWRSLGATQLAVVCAEDDIALHRELDRMGFPVRDRIHNPNPDEGMFSSIQAAARWPGWFKGLTHWAIVLGDQPHLRDKTLAAVLRTSAANSSKVCQPERAGHRRHPVIVPKSIFRQLARSSAANLKDFLAAIPNRIAACEVNDPGLELDIDLPGDYEKALAIKRGKD